MDNPYPPLRGTSLHGLCSPTDRHIPVADTRVLQVYMVLAIDGELMLIRGIDDERGTVEVDRGFGGTKAASHVPGSPIHIVTVAMPEVA